MAVYRITEWDERYEVSSDNRPLKPGQARRVSRLEYVRLPVFGEKLGKGWRRMWRLAGKREALQVFGVFCKLLEIAADKCADERGLVPGPDDVADILEVPVQQVVTAFQVLENVSWIEAVSLDSAEFSENRIQIKSNQIKTKQDNTPPTPSRGSVCDDSLFSRFWQAYPKKKAKDAARKAFAKRAPNEALLATMLAAIADQKRADSWTREKGRYIPHPATWLNGGCWDDHIDSEVKPSCTEAVYTCYDCGRQRYESQMEKHPTATWTHRCKGGCR